MQIEVEDFLCLKNYKKNSGYVSRECIDKYEARTLELLAKLLRICTNFIFQLTVKKCFASKTSRFGFLGSY